MYHAMLVLREGLHYCIANERAVILDLPANRYFCLPRPLEDAFQTAVLSELPDGKTSQCEQLVSLGVLVHADAKTPLRSALSLPPADMALESSGHSANVLAMIDALFCRRAAKHAVASSPLNALIAQVRRWKTDPSFTKRAIDSHLRRDIAAFSKSRRLHIAQDQCLSNSFALLRFLRRRRFLPSLVIGVKMSPFAAHAWVQSDTVVLADDIDKIRLYTPILVV